MGEKQREEKTPREKPKIRFKERLQFFNIIGYESKRKLIAKYGDSIEIALEKLENKRDLVKMLKKDLGSYYPRIWGALDQYLNEEIDKTLFISSGISSLGKKFVDIFIMDSREVLKVRRRNVYLTLNSIFIALVALCLVYFLLLMPVDVLEKPEGSFIFPGPENFEWIFAIIMAILVITIFGYLASTLLSSLTIKIYVKFVRKNQKLGLVPTENLFGKALYRKLIFRALFAGFLAYNISIALASSKVYISIMRSVNPEGINLIPDPELMVQSMWIAIIPVILLLVPIWLMMDIGLAKTSKVRGYNFDSADIAGSKVYNFIKGYAGITFIYNLIIITFVWASDDVPLIRLFMRFISPIIVFSFMFPLVVIIDYKNEVFKKKLWKKLQKFNINKKFKLNVEIELIDSYEEILDF